ncbi:adenylate/guanylate cyclase domain-containing protein [Modestobacter lapidis]|nr:adenylate/guanylate cyclase domain-containing protein [Modestobacter lapidis]
MTGGDAEEPEELLEELLLGGRRRYTRLDVARLAGLPAERTQRLWRALGFADVPDEAVVFTDADVAALGRLRELIDSGFVDATTEASIARAIGQSLSRLADWQTDMLAAALAGSADPAGDPQTDAAGVGRVVDATERLLPVMRDLQHYVWRRHLAANAGRLLPSHRQQVDRRDLAVGFADLVGYTTRSRGMGGRELGAMVEDFEGLAADVIARHRGRVVKTVGDGVLFTCAVPVDAVEIALQLPERWAAADRPPLRVGAAYGRVLTRLGDVYSPVVNLASRLTAVARPSTVLVDEALARHLRGVRAYRVRPLSRVSVRGYDQLQPWLVRRATPADEEGAGMHALEDLLDEIADEVLDPTEAPASEGPPPAS